MRSARASGDSTADSPPSGEVLYPDPVKASIRRAAADIAAYALGVTRKSDTDSESLDEYGLAEILRHRAGVFKPK